MSNTIYQSVDENDIERARSLSVTSNQQDTLTHDKDYFLWFYATFSSTTAIILGFATVLSVFLILIDTRMRDSFEVVHFMLRLYGLTLMVVAILSELEWFEAIRQSSILQNWTSRGIFLTFLGLFVFVEYSKLTLGRFKFVTMVAVVSLVIVLCGCVYTGMGLMNLKRLKNEKTVRYIQLLSQYEVRTE
mmetsp:Transcript_434/g.764  ORF Transcript_434/g.764 Transcript_434/m.764 type:complete len:189 (-) Transcript_434:1602-2168(-)